ncbi:hypothetical protein DPMN_022651 [Dreissena polymorpha]|uniref:Uncharacterized protein n=1 Tax=Dreissena polymorpha TaxID=45954 RepID=A0A9D4NPP1_DREPO|nr:hypothetical protein DPMN_022651 [Dreissena polymorpha]
MSGKTVCLLYVSPNNVIRLTKKINTSTKVFSICCMTPSNMVVSTYGEYGHPLRMITQAGVESDLNHCKFPKKWYGYEESRCTYVPSKNTLVLTDKIAHTVYMYDIVKGTTIAVTNENIEYPRGACRGPGDTVLVCIGAMNSILHLTADGDILDTYQVDMTLPFSLCMAQDGSKLAVSSGNGHKKLMVYKLS